MYEQTPEQTTFIQKSIEKREIETERDRDRDKEK
jgi:hypothetical protein